jgi:hypothetical protein
LISSVAGSQRTPGFLELRIGLTRDNPAVPSKPTYLDRTLDSLKNRPAVAWTVILVLVITGIGGVISAIKEVRGFWADGGSSSVDDCKYILANPLWDKPPSDFAGEFTFNLSSEMSRGRGLVSFTLSGMAMR